MKQNVLLSFQSNTAAATRVMHMWYSQAVIIEPRGSRERFMEAQ